MNCPYCGNVLPDPLDIENIDILRFYVHKYGKDRLKEIISSMIKILENETEGVKR